jgi:hypothetical protein
MGKTKLEKIAGRKNTTRTHYLPLANFIVFYKP